jgi:hypothetical protein
VAECQGEKQTNTRKGKRSEIASKRTSEWVCLKVVCVLFPTFRYTQIVASHTWHALSVQIRLQGSLHDTLQHHIIGRTPDAQLLCVRSRECNCKRVAKKTTSNQHQPTNQPNHLKLDPLEPLANLSLSSYMVLPSARGPAAAF